MDSSIPFARHFRKYFLSSVLQCHWIRRGSSWDIYKRCTWDSILRSIVGWTNAGVVSKRPKLPDSFEESPYNEATSRCTHFSSKKTLQLGRFATHCFPILQRTRTSAVTAYMAILGLTYPGVWSECHDGIISQTQAENDKR